VSDVFNIEVHGHHVYRITEDGVLVHNNSIGLLKGFGNIGSHAAMSADDALKHGINWLGSGYKEIAPGVFRSADGLRQFRLTTADLLGSHGKLGSHVHIEALDKFGKVIENLHLPIFWNEYSTMPKTLMTSTIARVKGTTTHGLGHFDASGKPVLDAEIESPCTLSIVSDESGVYLYRMNEVGECVADTWHLNVEEAQRQAEFEFEIDQYGWREN
jgi:hypothetical protein